MRLLDYSMIGLNGSVARPEPSATFADYQNSLATYQLKLSYRRRATGQAEAITSPQESLPDDDAGV